MSDYVFGKNSFFEALRNGTALIEYLFYLLFTFAKVIRKTESTKYFWLKDVNWKKFSYIFSIVNV